MNPRDWVVASAPYGNGQSVAVVELSGRTVCTFPSYDSASASARWENATLCAAAPAMLAALESLLSHGATDCIGGHGEYPCGERCETVVAAIRKAKGLKP